MRRPTTGGRYIRDPKSGTLKKADEVPVEAPAPAADPEPTVEKAVEKKGKK